MHLQLDGWTDGELTKLECNQAFHFIITKIEMTPVGRFCWEQTFEGPSAWQMLMESHLAIDYMKPGGKHYITVDLFSCKDFDAREACLLIRRLFRITRVKRCRLMNRGFG